MEMGFCLMLETIANIISAVLGVLFLVFVVIGPPVGILWYVLTKLSKIKE